MFPLLPADNRELRKQMAIAFGAKGFQNNEFDNQENVLKMPNCDLMSTSFRLSYPLCS
jgi:hypothetical protein